MSPINSMLFRYSDFCDSDKYYDKVMYSDYSDLEKFRLGILNYDTLQFFLIGGMDGPISFRTLKKFYCKYYDTKKVDLDNFAFIVLLKMIEYIEIPIYHDDLFEADLKLVRQIVHQLDDDFDHYFTK